MTMPFGLKNAGATYQRCMQACLKEQIGRNVEVYVDDIVITTAKADSLLDDLQETFTNLDRYSIKLNPKKCSFGVPTGQLLGYLISERGIEGNLEISDRNCFELLFRASSAFEIFEVGLRSLELSFRASSAFEIFEAGLRSLELSF
jgi:hypothetical protein